MRPGINSLKIAEDMHSMILLNDSKEKVGYKIRQQSLQKVPFMIIIGSNEIEKGEVNLRLLDGTQVNFSNTESAIEHLIQQCQSPDTVASLD